MAYVNLQPHEGEIISKPVSGVKKLLAKFVSLDFFIALVRLLLLAKYYKQIELCWLKHLLIILKKINYFIQLCVLNYAI